MNFINTQLNLHDLPRWETVELQPIHRDYLRVLRIEWMIVSAVIIAIAALLIYLIPPLTASYGWIVLTAGAFLLIGVYRFMIEKTFPYQAYAVRDKDVLHRRGWIVRSVKVCPFNRIQNCSVQSGPIERKHGLASLLIYTAGQGNADMKIPGLLQEEAERLRHFILEKIHTEDEGV